MVMGEFSRTCLSLSMTMSDSEAEINFATELTIVVLKFFFYIFNIFHEFKKMVKQFMHFLWVPTTENYVLSK